MSAGSVCVCVLMADSSLVNWRKPDSTILKINSPGAMWRPALFWGLCVHSLLDLAVSTGRARAELVIWGWAGGKSGFDAANVSRFTRNAGCCGSFLGCII